MNEQKQKDSNEEVTRSDIPSNKNFTLESTSIQATLGDGSLTQQQMGYTLSQNIPVTQITESEQRHHRDILEQNLPELPKSRSVSPEMNNRSTRLSSLKQYLTCGNILFFLPNLIELGVIGYGIGLYCSGEIEKGLTFMITFGIIFIATVIAQYCMCSRWNFVFKKDSPSSENNGSIEEVDVTTDVNRQTTIQA